MLRVEADVRSSWWIGTTLKKKPSKLPKKLREKEDECCCGTSIKAVRVLVDGEEVARKWASPIMLGHISYDLGMLHMAHLVSLMEINRVYSNGEESYHEDDHFEGEENNESEEYESGSSYDNEPGCI
ncbi:hypothetical protein L6452_14726 [Arctium lappa]|uniref:Uncharacterized protein n=1 Tax=Arctium lappa TaxID=4217 RepID=A0ACB9CLR9_ARCLA|nr:hypothetical protein L6452_14726 [Arctium lappa]